MELDRKTVKTIGRLIAFGVLLDAAVHNMDIIRYGISVLLGVLSPVLFGLSIAFVLNVPVSLFERHIFVRRGGKVSMFFWKIRRPVSIILSMVLVTALLAGMIVVLVPQLTAAIARLAGQMQVWMDSVRIHVQQHEGETSEFSRWVATLNLDWDSIRAQVTDYFKYGIGSAVRMLSTAATSVFGWVANLVLAVVLAINVLAGKELLSRQGKSFVRAYLKPRAAQRTIDIAQLAHRIFSAFLTGQMTEALILAALCYIGMLILRFPYASLVSMMVGVGALIPIFGALTSALLGTLMVATLDPLQALGFLTFFIILQQLEGNLIYPRVVGTHVGLPVVWVMVAITVGGGLLGVTGMILGVPACALVYSLVRDSVRQRNTARGLSSEERGVVRKEGEQEQ